MEHYYSKYAFNFNWSNNNGQNAKIGSGSNNIFNNNTHNLFGSSNNTPSLFTNNSHFMPSQKTQQTGFILTNPILPNQQKAQTNSQSFFGNNQAIGINLLGTGSNNPVTGLNLQGTGFNSTGMNIASHGTNNSSPANPFKNNPSPLMNACLQNQPYLSINSSSTSLFPQNPPF
jgi:hypothetical protein